MNPIAAVFEYPPLLVPGLHLHTISELKNLCVDPFPHSSTRQDIMTGFEAVVNSLSSKNIDAEVWVNGSFLTEKLNPNDSDIVVWVDESVFKNGSGDTRKVLTWINSNLRDQHLCDSYICTKYPNTSQQYTLNEYHHAYWLRQFGFSRGIEYKGIAVLRVKDI